MNTSTSYRYVRDFLLWVTHCLVSTGTWYPPGWKNCTLGQKLQKFKEGRYVGYFFFLSLCFLAQLPNECSARMTEGTQPQASWEMMRPQSITLSGGPKRLSHERCCYPCHCAKPGLYLRHQFDSDSFSPQVRFASALVTGFDKCHLPYILQSMTFKGLLT